MRCHPDVLGIVTDLVTGRRTTGALVGLAVATIAWQLWPAAPVSPPHRAVTQLRPSYTVVPLTGDPVADAVEDGRCVPFLRPLVAMPNWKLQIASGDSGCMGDTVYDSYAIHADGTVTWSRRAMPTRTLVLTDDEMRIVRSLDTVSCADLQPEHGYYVGWYRLGVGDDLTAHDGAEIPVKSALGARLDELFEAARARYRRQILALGTVRAWIDDTSSGTRYRVQIRDHQLRIFHHGRLLVDDTLDDDDLVDLIDAARLGTPPASDDWVIGRGELHVAGHRYKIAITPAELGPFGHIDRAFSDASYEESKASSR